jgi:D-cysteine desulfhydrase family pyridoxal phosphate-dependent enzyme
MNTDLVADLKRCERKVFLDEPTSFHALNHLAKTIGGPELYIKRDDMGPLAFGGNKLRQLEFYFGDAVARGADTILITGAVQSNFVRLAAACAAKLGMHCHIQLEERVSKMDVNYRNSGNVLLNQILGAILHSYPAGEDERGADLNLEKLALNVREQGGIPYVIHLSSDYPSIGALGYVAGAIELAQQIQSRNITLSAIVVPSGSGATHAGMLYGMRALGISTPIIGACVRRSASEQVHRIRTHCDSMARQLRQTNPVGTDDIILNEKFLAPGYGRAGAHANEAIKLSARLEGIILDPVYSAKSFACFIDYARRNINGDPLLFLHTGGLPAIFAYQDDMLAAVS